MDTLSPTYQSTQWAPSAAQKRRMRTKSACLGKLCNSLKMCGLSKDAKPWLSYVSLITVALLSNPTKMLKISEIYAFIEQTFPYYRYSRTNWRNSVRHNLSLNDCFVKVTVGPEKGKRRGHYWTLHPDSFTMFDKGSLMRRHRRFVKPSSESTDASKANVENALVMPILQKISEELTRWRQHTRSLEAEAWSSSVDDYISANAQVGYLNGNQAAQNAPFNHYDHCMQTTQFPTFNPAPAYNNYSCTANSCDIENYGYCCSAPIQAQIGPTTPHTPFTPIMPNSPTCAQCLVVSNQTLPQSDWMCNECRPMMETTSYSSQHFHDALSGDYVPSVL